MLVEPGVDPDVVSSHLLQCELLDLLDRPGSAVLEADAVQPLVQVDGVLPGDHLAHGGPLLLVLRRHPELCEGKHTMVNILVSQQFFQ